MKFVSSTIPGSPNGTNNVKFLVTTLPGSPNGTNNVTFNGGGFFTFTIDALLIGGGGSGGAPVGGGGGGAGSIHLVQNLTISRKKSYNVSVGTGGIFDTINNIPARGDGSSFTADNGTFSVIGGGYGASGLSTATAGSPGGPDPNYLAAFPGGGGGSEFGVTVHVTETYGGGADGVFGHAGGQGNDEDLELPPFGDFMAGGGGGYATAGNNGGSGTWTYPGNNPPVNGGNGIMFSSIWPDAIASPTNALIDMSMGAGGGGAVTKWGGSSTQNTYVNGGYYGGRVNAGPAGGQGGSYNLDFYDNTTITTIKAAVNGAGYLSYPPGYILGVGNGGGGGGGNGSNGGVFLKIPDYVPIDIDATTNASYYLNGPSDPVNGYIYLFYPFSGSLIIM